MSLFEVDGIDLPALLAEHLGPRLLEAWLIRPGAPGGRDPDNLTRVLEPGPATEYPCRGFIEKFSDFSVASGLVLASDRKLTLLGGTLPVGIVPQAGPGRDRVRIEGAEWVAHQLLDRDPSAATYVIQARDPKEQS